MFDVLYRDPPLALATMIIVALLIYIEIMHLRLLFITKTLEIAINSMRQESQRGGLGCAGITLITVIVSMLLIFALMINTW